MEINPEIRNRIRVAVAAYAYEIKNDPVMSDAEYDELARSIDPRILTGHEILDEFFRTDFSVVTGLWVHSHPDKTGLERVYRLMCHTHDQKHNHDLFGPILHKPEPVKHACLVCGKDKTENPLNGGCHC